MTGPRWTGRFRRNALRALFEEHPDAVYVFDVEGRFVAGNAALAERVGIPWERLREMDFGPTVHPDDRETIAAEFQRAVDGETRHYRGRGIRPDGATFFADIVNIPLWHRSHVVGVLGVGRDVDDLADTRAALDTRDRLVRIAGRVAKVGGWVADLTTGERHWSEEMSRLIGFESGETVTRDDLLARVAPRYRERINRAFERCTLEGTPMDLVVPFPVTADDERHMRLIGEPVRDGSGRIVQVHGAVIDVTASVAARRERRRMDARLTAALDGVRDALVFLDSEWHIRYLNRAAADALGRSSRELVGADLRSVTELAEATMTAVRAAMSTRVSHAERHYDAPSGRWIESLAFPADDLLGVSMSDVSARETARLAAIDDPRRQYAQSSVFDSTTDAVFVRGLGDRVEYWNASAAKLLGLGPDEDVTGRRLRDLLGADPVAYADAEATVAASDHWGGDLTVRRDGTVRLLESRWLLVRDPLGAPEAVFCIVNDVTESRRDEELTVRAQRMESIGTLAGGIAHDLNNVLTPLLLSTQRLAAGEDDPERLRLLAGMQQTIERGAKMIRQVLTFARGVEGDRTLVDVAELAKGFSDFCRDTLPKNLTLEVTVEPGLAVIGDATQLLQVLMNLATNARDVMPDGGHLAFAAHTAGDRALLTLRDEGPGIPPEARARLFEPFFTTKPAGRGTGLGLSVSQSIAESHDGTLDVATTGPDGTVFQLDLPRAPTDTVATAPPPRDATAIDLHGAHVLVVDDEESVVEATREMIVLAGGECVSANDVDGARQLLQHGGVDVVLTDLVMPGITGREFLDWLERYRPHLPVVAMTGIPEQGDAAARHANVRTVLDKPFTAEELLVALEAALHRSPA